MNKNVVFVFLLLISVSCCYTPRSVAYRSFYAHLNRPSAYPVVNHKSDHFVIIYVNARHLDYTDNYSFLNTVLKHPSDGSTNRDFGHVWIYVQGIVEQESVYLYGGHSGERGLSQAKYFDGIMNYIDFGYSNPTPQEKLHPRYEENPVKYLWETQIDGYFQFGAGGHCPTYAAKINLTRDQFARIMEFASIYDYSHYSLTENQCSSFAAQVASLAGLDLDCEVTMRLNNELWLKGERIRFWSDPCYSFLTISSPDVVERSLMRAVDEGRAEHVHCKGEKR